MAWTILQIDETIDVSAFDCGVSPLNSFLLRYALNNQQEGFGSTYVAVDEGKLLAVGYFTLSNAEIRFESLPPDSRKRVPRYPLSAIRLARLAVDKRQKGAGLGAYLMKRALEIFVEQGEKIRAFALVVDAKDAQAVAFYKKYGFIQYHDKTDSLFLPWKTIESAVRGEK